MRTTRYFELRMQHPSRAGINVEICERVVKHPIAEERQDNGEWRLWGYIEESGRFLRVITSEDREELINAFWDRGFKRRSR